MVSVSQVEGSVKVWNTSNELDQSNRLIKMVEMGDVILFNQIIEDQGIIIA